MLKKPYPKLLKSLLLAIACIGLLFYVFFDSNVVNTSESEKIIQKNLEDLLNIQEKHLSYLKRYNLKVPSQCGRFPNHEDLNITNTYWQVTNTSNGTFYLFNAYYDDREAVNGSVVRILGMVDRIHPTVETYCQMWFFGIIEPIPVKVDEYILLWPDYWQANTDGATPYLITCKNPFANEGLVPSHVSLVEEKCSDANNIFAVINNRFNDRKKKLFLVCWRGAHFEEDISLQVIEWAEILKILGVDNVVVYVEKLHPNVMNVLRHYNKSRFFIIKFIDYPQQYQKTLSESYSQCLQNELISYHDAFYEHLYAYEFMIPMDLDEIIMPLREEDRTWEDLIKRTNERLKGVKGIIDSYNAMSRFFILKSPHENEVIKGIPKKLRFLSNVYRAENFTAIGGTKAFMRMDRVLAVHNHFPLLCIDPESCNSHSIDYLDGQLSHYRTDCESPECEASKQNPVKDTTLWKYKDEILENIIKTLDELRVELSEIPEDYNLLLQNYSDR